MTIFEFLRNHLQGEKPVHPVEAAMAKRWVKERLKDMYPEMRHDPRELERMYRALSLEPREGGGEGGSILFEVVLPGRIE
jgi:hypothetical protein